MTLSQELVHPDCKRNLYLGIVCLGVSAIAVNSKDESIKAVALIILFGTSYHTLNCMIDYRFCPEYFYIGNQKPKNAAERREFSLVRSENSCLNSVAWGINSSWKKISLLGVFLAALARCPCQCFPQRMSMRKITETFKYPAIGFVIVAGVIKLISIVVLRKALAQEIRNECNANDLDSVRLKICVPLISNMLTRYIYCFFGISCATGIILARTRLLSPQ